MALETEQLRAKIGEQHIRITELEAELARYRQLDEQLGKREFRPVHQPTQADYEKGPCIVMDLGEGKLKGGV